MSDPLSATYKKVSELELAKRALQPMSRLAMEKSLMAAPLTKDSHAVGVKFSKAQVDVQLTYGVLVKPYSRWVGDPTLVQRLAGKGAAEVMFAANTAKPSFSPPLPRLQSIAADMFDEYKRDFEEGKGRNYLYTPDSVLKTAQSMVYAGGGVQATHKRLLDRLPKRGWRPEAPFTAEEVDVAMEAVGRGLNSVLQGGAAPLRITMEEVKTNSDSGNGYPVGGKFANPEARALVLELAAELNQSLKELGSEAKKLGHLKYLSENHVGLMLCEGKTKTDLYKATKVTAGECRFYYTFGRHLVLIMQTATQPLSDAWKAEKPESWRTGIGKGLSGGGADALVQYLDSELQGGEDFTWSHCGDDTMCAAVADDKVALFSLDCTAFDLTQHAAVSAPVKHAFATQLKAISMEAGVVWQHMSEERTVTINGAVCMRTKHGGPSGMPLQSEINDTLMECFLQRVKKRDWWGRAELDAVLAQEAARVGFIVRLEDYCEFKLPSMWREQLYCPVRYVLSKRPFKYVGYDLYVAEDNAGLLGPRYAPVRCVTDFPRFLAGMPYLTGGFVKDAGATGARAALVLAGLALSFGVPPTHLYMAFQTLRKAALDSLDALGHLLSDDEITNELGRYVYAQLPVDVKGVEGLKAALNRAESIWATQWDEALHEAAVINTLGKPILNWADDVEDNPPDEFVLHARRLLLPKAVEAKAAPPGKVGRPPPLAREELERRAAHDAEQARVRNLRAEEKDVPSRKKGKRGKRQQVLSESDYESAPSEEDWDWGFR